MIDPLLALSLLTWGFLILVGIIAVALALMIHWHKTEERMIAALEREENERSSTGISNNA